MELKAELRNRKETGLVPDSDSDNNSDCSSCGTPIHSGSVDVNNTSKKQIDADSAVAQAAAAEAAEAEAAEAEAEAAAAEAAAAEAAEAPSTTADALFSEKSTSNKRKFDADSESSTQRHRDF